MENCPDCQRFHINRLKKLRSDVTQFPPVRIHATISCWQGFNRHFFYLSRLFYQHNLDKASSCNPNKGREKIQHMYDHVYTSQFVPKLQCLSEFFYTMNKLVYFP